MSMYTLVVFFYFFYLNAVCSGDVRSSLTFVIDKSGSMHNIIDKVRLDVDSIFDTVMNSKFTHIEDFVLVMFEETVTPCTTTKDRRIFKEALATIKADGGGDCPEKCLSAIKIALENSREASSLYIFTDASAKDYEMAPEIETLSQKKQIQLVFVLTDDCGGSDDKDYKVYEKLAKATLGHVFHVKEYDIDEILDYIKNSIRNRKNLLTVKTFPPGDSHFDVTVDGDTKELVIAVSGLDPTVGVKDSKGSTMPTECTTNFTDFAEVKVSDVKPGVYKVEVDTKSETTVSVSGTTSVHFQHGFSILKPTAITDTTTMPIPDKSSYLSIKLATERKVELRSVQILHMNDTVFLEKPLRLEDEAEQFYFSEPLVPPNNSFRIAIKGYDLESNTLLTRFSLTPIRSQEKTVTAVEKAPKVSIDGAPKTEVKFGEPFQLKCKVSGYPAPNITWESDDPTAILSHNDSPVEIPYDFLSVLYIKNATKNWKYTCKAVNKVKTDFESIAVKVVRKKTLEIKVSNDTSIAYKKRGEIYCQVNAWPPATVLWYKDRRPLVTDSNLALSYDNSTLTIRSMEPGADGNYTCEVRHDVERKEYLIRVSITGIVKPKINKNTYQYVRFKNSSVDIKCDEFRGKPKPTFTWYHSVKTAPYGPFTKLSDETTDTIHISHVGEEHGGRYRCQVSNVKGQDTHDIDLVVEFAPTQTVRVRERIVALAGDEVTLPCPAHGQPPVNFTWSLDGRELTSDYIVIRDGSLRLRAASLSSAGNYECVSSNEHGLIRIITYLDVIVPVNIETPKESIKTVKSGKYLDLPCKAGGFPIPTISWIFYSKDLSGRKELKPSDSSGSLRFKNIQPNQAGVYTCFASNDVSSQNITYTINVTVSPFIAYTKKQFTAVLDDYVLQMPCNASGNPKPGIIWKHNGYELGLPSYSVDEEGTLSVFNINKRSGGIYDCFASNKYGVAHETFGVIIETCPVEGIPESTIWLEEGKPASISCNVPRLGTDRLRWFKDRMMISKEELFLNPVTLIDSGVYTCRVSSVSGRIQTSSTKVEVWSKPQFVSNVPKDIKFEESSYASLICDARGIPKPEVRWFHDDIPLGVFSDSHEVEMTSSRDEGRYRCIVSNKFGTIEREYRILTYECDLDIKKDFYGNQPVITDLSRHKLIDGHIRIPGGETINLICPNNRNRFKNRNAIELTVECVNEKLFSYGPNRYLFSDLKCQERVKIVVKRNNTPCMSGKSKMKSIGFNIRRKFKEVYQVCLNLTGNNIYTKQTIEMFRADVVPAYDIGWDPWGWSLDDLETLYDCRHQKDVISRTLDKNFHRRDECCFARRQLVSARDVAPGPAQVATYLRLNVAPQWSTCHSENWLDVEERIRYLANSRPLQVWTGTANTLRMHDKDIVITLDTRVEVPEYFWKVVQDPESGASLAIVQVNMPDMHREDMQRRTRCKDICNGVDWMRNGRQWGRYARGYTYCCTLEQFEKEFHLLGVFPRLYPVLNPIVY